jgi:hypothetical protein
MTENMLNAVIPGVIIVLMLILIFRIKGQIKRAIKNEIYSNFPTIKSEIESFTRRIDFLKTQADELERKISRLADKGGQGAGKS